MFDPLACRSRARSLLLWSLLIIAVSTLLVAASEVQAATARTPGSFVLASNGAATYTIPIFAPHGPAGLQPNISLVYNSQSSVGYVGVGWSLAGLSSISRCNHTYAQDGAPAAVALSISDGYCLDGQRLLLTSGSYGVDASTYQTEVTNFSLVTAHGSAGNGPAYFTVQGRDGLTYEYGNIGGSQVLATNTSTVWMWMIDKVTDRAGNTMTYTYNTATGATVPASISWTPSSQGSSTYNYTMLFAYGANTGSSSINAYLAGTQITDRSLLGSITIQYAGATVKKYVLTYQLAPNTVREELIQVQECADSGATNCLTPTKITYQNGVQGVGGAATLATASGSTPPPQVLTAYDLNGDGINDFLWEDTGGWHVAFGGPSGFGAPISTGVTATGVVVGDLDGSGTDGLLAPIGGAWWYYKWNGTGFSGAPIPGVSVDSTTAGSYAVADLNGDGLADLITTRSDGFLYVRLNTSTPSGISFSTSVTKTIPNNFYAIYGTWNTRHLDFYGSGQKDLMGLITNGTNNGIYALHFNGTTFVTTNFGELSVVDVGDFNNDGCTDVLASDRLLLSSCSGAVASVISLGNTAVLGIDWDNDGHLDILVQNGTNLGVSKWDGFVWGPVSPTSLPTSGHSFAYYRIHNATGDGSDALINEPLTGPFTFQYYLHNGAGQPPDLMTNVTDGFGNSVSLAYVSLARSVNATYFLWNDAQYPYQNYFGPVYLTSQAVFSDPSSTSGGTYYQNYYYAGLWLNVQGRGLSPFGNVQTYDSRNGVWDTLGYQRTFPYTGMLAGETRTTNNSSSGMLFSDSPSVLYTTNGSNSHIYFPYISSDTTKSYELGVSSTRLVSTTATGYSYDSYGNATSISKTVTDNDTGSPYYGQWWKAVATNTPVPGTSTWCLNLLTQVQVAYTASNDAAVTRTRQFTPDLTNCRYTEIVTEPSSANYKVTEDFGYDGFGNINSDTVTGVGMTARQTTVGWGTTGQFPMTVVDPTGAATGTTSYDYDFRFGLRSQVVDPNGLSTTDQYDSFGRKTREDRPDKTYTTWTYQAFPNLSCNTFASCGILRSVSNRYDYDTSGNILAQGGSSYDPVDREFEAGRLMPGSKDSVVDTYYDSLGRVASRSEPFFWGDTQYFQTYLYDTLGRLKQSQRPISATNSALQTTTYQYSGDATTITDPQNNAKTLINAPNNTLRQSKDAYGYAITLGYDAAGTKTSVTDSLGNSLWSGSYAQGIQPFLTGFTDMDRGNWVITPDALGEATGWTDGTSQHHSMTYDALSRPVTRTEPDYYTQWTWGSSASSHNIGRLQSVCTGASGACTSARYSESETYDDKGRLYQRAITIPNLRTFTYTWQYNTTTGLLDTLTYPISTSTYALQLKYAYSNGYLTSVTDISDSPNVTVWTANATDPVDHITQETLGNGIVVSRAYDAVTHWLSSIQAGVASGAGVQNQSFLYDEVGNVTQRQDNALGLTENAYYDNDYRLTSTRLNGTQNLSVTYDNTMGNILSRSDIAGGATWTYSATQKHAVTQAGSSSYAFSYDPNGMMYSRQGQSIHWTSYQRADSISAGAGSTAENVRLSYGANRERWLQIYTGNGVTESTYYVGDLLDIAMSGGVNDFRHYIYDASGTPVAVYSRKTNGVNALSYLLSDQQASVAKIANSSGGVTVTESFTPFGNRRDPSTWSGSASNTDLTTSAGVTRQGYTFQTQLGLWMGLNHMNGRVQDPIIGRFISPDPQGTQDGDPQTYNRYSYALNNPLTYIDPSGFEICVPHQVYNGPQDQTDSGPSFTTETYNDCTPDTMPQVDILGHRPPPPPPWAWPSLSLRPVSWSVVPYGPTVTFGGGASPPQGNARNNQACLAPEETPTVTVTGKLGAYGEGEVELGGFKIHAEVNLFTVNVPVHGSSYLTQGIGLSAAFFGATKIPFTNRPLGIGLERTSEDGGLTWNDWSWYGTSDNIRASKEGLAVSASVGLGAGGEVSFSHLENLLTGDTPCTSRRR